MTMSQIHHPPQRSADPADVNQSHGQSQFSVAELQRVLRQLRAGHATSPPADGRPKTATRADEICLPKDSIQVMGVHPGAGATTIALTIAEAAAANGRPVDLVELADPARSGLVAAASAELGVDASGQWRRGTRAGGVTIHRRAAEGVEATWPPHSTPERHMAVVDWPGQPVLPVRRRGRPRLVVVVFRGTVPGVRQAEHVLASAPDARFVAAAIGSSKWPRNVCATLGPHLQALRDGKRLVTVPVDRRLETCGLTANPLPKPVTAAGRALLALLHADADADAQSAPSAELVQLSLPFEENQ
jgi:hypothetical protein